MARILSRLLRHILPLVVMPSDLRRVLEVQDKTQETETPLGQVPHFGRALELCMDIFYFVLWGGCASARLR